MKVWTWQDEEEIEDMQRPVNMRRALLNGIIFSVCFGAFFWLLACI